MNVWETFIIGYYYQIIMEIKEMDRFFIKGLVLFLLLYLSTILTFAEENPLPAKYFEYEKNKSGDGIIIKKFLHEKLPQKKQEKIIIPCMIGKLPVVELGEDAFRGYHRNKDKNRETVFSYYHDNDTICHYIIIPDTVKKIGAGCFAFSTFMEIKLPSGLEHIEDEVFMSVTVGGDIELPYRVTTIGKRAFAFSSTSCIRLPKYLKSIGVEAFRGSHIRGHRYCRGLKLYEGLEEIGDRAFLNSSIEFISGDDEGELINIKTIGKDAFKGCELGRNEFEREVIAKLDAIIAGRNAEATEMPNPASDFKYELNSERTGVVIKEFTGERRKVIIPSTIEDFPVVILGERAFMDSKIVSVVIPDSVSCIKSFCFQRCEFLEKVILLKGLKVLSKRCFVGCRSLKEITLPEGLEEIEKEAFSFSGLKSIVIPDSIKRLDGFDNCKNLKTVTLGRGVQEISSSAFGKCTALTTVIGGDNVGKIGEKAFENCTSLTNISMGKKLQVVEDSAFEGCASLITFTMNNNLKKEMGGKVFQGCKKLTTVTIGDNLRWIGGCAFYACEALTTVTIGDNLSVINDFAFENCEALTTVTIGKGIKEIGNGAFAGCSSLTTFNIDLSESVIYRYGGYGYHGTYVFKGCSSLSLKEKAKIMKSGYKGEF